MILEDEEEEVFLFLRHDHPDPQAAHLPIALLVFQR
jgi:hypothetical protein